MRFLLVAAMLLPLVTGCATAKQQSQRSSTYSTQSDSKEARLNALKEERMSGLLTRDEYLAARERILNEP